MKDKILEKIKKLIAHAESAGEIGSSDEAAAFAEKIKALLDAHDLTMTDVEIHAAKSSPIDAEALTFINPLKRSEWLRILLGTIATVNGCMLAENSFLFVIIGREADRKVAISFSQYFYSLCLRLEHEFIDKALGPEPDTFPNINKFQGISLLEFLLMDRGPTLGEIPIRDRAEAYMLGIVMAIRRNLRANRTDAVNNINPAALVYLDGRVHEAAAWVKEFIGKDLPEMELDPELGDRSSFEAGLRAGDRIAITDKTLKANAI